LTNLVRRLSGIRAQSGQTNEEECGPCPVFASYTLALALQLRKSTEPPQVKILFLIQKLLFFEEGLRKGTNQI